MHFEESKSIFDPKKLFLGKKNKKFKFKYCLIKFRMKNELFFFFTNIGFKFI